MHHLMKLKLSHLIIQEKILDHKGVIHKTVWQRRIQIDLLVKS